MLNLDTKLRAGLTAQIIQHLQEFVPNSLASLRGSLAEGRADAYSDIDLVWQVPGNFFPVCLDKLPAILAQAAPVESFRSDPDYYNSPDCRLFFVRFEGLPLFWRLDLLVRAISDAQKGSRPEDNAVSQLNPAWSWSESALANCVAAIKNHLRGNNVEAKALLGRAYQRLNLTLPKGKDLANLILYLVNYLERQEPEISGLAVRVRDLAAASFNLEAGGN